MPLVLRAVGAGGWCLEARFEFVQGRFQHVISAINESDNVVASWVDEFESADEDWPASPPIQQLSLESIQDKLTLLGVGQAGKSHWSISVETSDGDSPLILFDIACRTKQQPLWLGSTYRATAESSVCFNVVADDRSKVEMQATRTVINCELPDANKLPKTFRWTYRVLLTAPNSVCGRAVAPGISRSEPAASADPLTSQH